MDVAFWILLVILIAVGWVGLSTDPFATALRVRFQGAKAQATDLVDDAVARIDTAIVATDRQITKAKKGLLAIKTERKLIERKFNMAVATVVRYIAAQENAGSIQRADLVELAVSKRLAAETLRDQLQAQLNLVTSKETKIEEAVEKLEERRRGLDNSKVEVRTRARTATVVISTNELLADIDVEGSQSDVVRAYELVENLEAEAGAMEEMADKAVTPDSLEAELEALASGTATHDVRSEVDIIMARYKKDEPAA